MKNLIIAAISLTLFACVEPPTPTVAWHNMCFPVQYLSPASIHASTQSDPNFDTDGGAPSVFYDAEYLKNKLSDFQPTHTSEQYGKLLNNMMVNILLRDKPGKIDSAGIDVTPFEQSKNLFKKTDDPYSLTLFDNINGELELWGTCSLFSQGNYICMRSFYHKDMLLTYDIHMDNLLLYREIDEFIINDLTQWQCE
jgi:hypothetical protein